MCGQCHVEYYFKGPEKRLTYPWRDGIKGDEILAYYEKEGFSDWTHAETGAKTLKAQHPEFEMYNQGIHARSGVACADCHMPYKREGSQKVSDHWVRSPLLNINRACQTCHKWSEEELKARVETLQGRVFELRNRAMDALMSLIADTKAARDKGASEDSSNRPARISAGHSSCSTSWKQRIRSASTRLRKPSDCWRSRSTIRDRARLRCCAPAHRRPAGADADGGHHDGAAAVRALCGGRLGRLATSTDHVHADR